MKYDGLLVRLRNLSTRVRPRFLIIFSHTADECVDLTGAQAARVVCEHS